MESGVLCNVLGCVGLKASNLKIPHQYHTREQGSRPEIYYSVYSVATMYHWESLNMKRKQFRLLLLLQIIIMLLTLYYEIAFKGNSQNTDGTF